jgi:hypothetical protein
MRFFSLTASFYELQVVKCFRFDSFPAFRLLRFCSQLIDAAARGLLALDSFSEALTTPHHLLSARPSGEPNPNCAVRSGESMAEPAPSTESVVVDPDAVRAGSRQCLFTLPLVLRFGVSLVIGQAYCRFSLAPSGITPFST